MANQIHTDPGWRAPGLDKIGEPRGPARALEGALILLAPFDPDPDGGLPKEIYDDSGALLPSVPRCEALARDEIEFAARQFNVYEHFHGRSLKSTEVEQQLENLAHSIRQLRNAIEGSSDEARMLLFTSGTRMFKPRFSSLVRKARLRQLPEPFTDPKSSKYVRQLSAFEEHVLQTRRNFRVVRGLATADSKDRGGNKNFFYEEHGNPRRFLAGQAIVAFERFAKRPTTTEGGPLHLLAQGIYEYATGREPEDSRMMQWLKACLKDHRRKCAAREKAYALRAQYEAVAASDLPVDHPHVRDVVRKFLAADQEYLDAIMTSAGHTSRSSLGRR